MGAAWAHTHSMLDFSSDMMVKGKSVLGSLEIQMRLLDLQNHVTINKINKVGWSLTAGCSPPPGNPEATEAVGVVMALQWVCHVIGIGILRRGWQVNQGGLQGCAQGHYWSRGLL